MLEQEYLKAFGAKLYDKVKIDFLQVGLTKQYINLTPAKYPKVTENVDVTIHSARRVDFKSDTPFI